MPLRLGMFSDFLIGNAFAFGTLIFSGKKTCVPYMST